MHDFNYKGEELYCEDLKVSDIAKEYGTPFYLYSYNTLADHFNKLKTAFAKKDPLICFSVKSNSNLTILKELVTLGAGLDIVSGGELFRALKAGCSPAKIVYAGVGKTTKEIEEALNAGIKLFNVESSAELENIDVIAGSLGKKVTVALRINPDVDPKTHKYITTGKKENKFGIDLESAFDIFKTKSRYENIDLKAIHCHIGSQLTDINPYVKALFKVGDFVNDLKEAGITIEILNLGGGLGIIYDEEEPATAQEFANQIMPLISKINVKELIFEPGRFIAGNAGILVSQVQYIKKSGEKNFVILDAGMNDLARPSLYSAYHKIEALTLKDNKISSDIVGPICESGDCFANNRVISEVIRGDYLAIFSTGAYGFTMASNYNSRTRPAEILVKDGKAVIIREQESYEDLVRGEI